MPPNIENQYLHVVKKAYSYAIMLYLMVPFFTPFTLLLNVAYLKFKFSRYTFDNGVVSRYYAFLYTMMIQNLIINAIAVGLLYFGYREGMFMSFLSTIYYMIRIVFKNASLPHRV